MVTTAGERSPNMSDMDSQREEIASVTIAYRECNLEYKQVVVPHID